MYKESFEDIHEDWKLRQVEIGNKYFNLIPDLTDLIFMVQESR
jgi:hypothetical protein